MICNAYHQGNVAAPQRRSDAGFTHQKQFAFAHSESPVLLFAGMVALRIFFGQSGWKIIAKATRPIAKCRMRIIWRQLEPDLEPMSHPEIRRLMNHGYSPQFETMIAPRHQDAASDAPLSLSTNHDFTSRPTGNSAG